MSTYSILLNILDRVREEAPQEFVTYRPDPLDTEKLNQARSRAYIHLYLKAYLGVLDFRIRESLITDGVSDGGIDGYYIDSTSKTIYFLQSKFRTKETTFQAKEIQVGEILKMDTDRILSGEIAHENGVQYNAKILDMQRKIREIPDIGRYRYEVIILANLKKISESKLRLLTGGLPCKVFDYKRAYSDLVLPIITGTYYKYSEINISVNLSNKSEGGKIIYVVETELGPCEIRVLFVPLTEIGRLMFDYKNSILKYNPRSFLTLKEGTINDEIKQTVLRKVINEFALFNNGITILSDETGFNPKTGQKDRAQLSLRNPQIINGGQTAYTLSIIYEEALEKDKSLIEKLDSKEVMLKVITLKMSKEVSAEKKLKLIESISTATNKQNSVDPADRQSNNKRLIDAQKNLFSDFGILLERKRGEFYDGLRYEYINKNELIDRAIFMRIAYATLGYLNHPKKRKKSSQIKELRRF